MTAEPPAPLPVEDVLRAWQDPVFRARLDEGELARLPDSPVGILDLADLPAD
ncbi:mersacidin/lichenicidin family type 2 lantibiotic [Plantactinospora sp. ZYX-F-223]|uniref:mersacidin/lichenicidin family type 2 lantibiotic n=1 Tax=Plantactinospora sp. ZYX-F-223 TaxID=3144103 RepID=UPI0031FDB6D9